MATKPKTTKLTKNGVEILNAIRNDASLSFQERVPAATQEDIREYGSAILQFQALQNEFVDALVNRIGKVILSSRLYKNPFAMLKKGMLDYGETIEEVYTSLAKAKIYDPESAETDFMKREMPDVQSIFHKIDYKNLFKVTVQRRDLERAFLSADGVYNLVSDIVSSLYSGMEYDEFITMKQLIVEYAKKGLFYEVEIPAVTADNMRGIISTVKGYSNKFTFMSTQYNAMGVPTYSDRSSQIIFIDSDFDALMDVEVLAAAFNMDKAEFMGRRILIDNFGELTGAKLLLCDESFFQIYDVLMQFESVRNPEGLYWNYFLHKWTVFSVSRFANAVLFTVPENKITGITLVPSNSTVQEKQLPRDITINATIASTGEVDQTLEWEMTGNESTETTMTIVNNTQVKVHVSANEKVPNSFNVVAKSKYFPVSGSATINTVQNP